MYENPLTKLADRQIDQALEDALERLDGAFIGELLAEIARRGQLVEV